MRLRQSVEKVNVALLRNRSYGKILVLKILMESDMIKAMSKDHRALLVGFVLLGALALHMLLVSCSSNDEHKISPQHKIPPPGFKILCNSSHSEFLPVMPFGTRLYNRRRLGDKGFDSYDDALERAWEMYNFKPPKPDTTKWEECQQEENVLNTPQAKETAGEGLTLMPGESFTTTIGGVDDSSGAILVRENHYFLYRPKDDITPHEIALLLPLFTGVYYGMGEYSTGGAIVPIKDRMRGGWPADITIPIFKIDAYELSRLGSAQRHLVELPR